MSDFRCPACAGTGLADEATDERQKARLDEGIAEASRIDRRWRLAAEVVLAGILINDVPALEFIGRVVELGERVADV